MEKANLIIDSNCFNKLSMLEIFDGCQKNYEKYTKVEKTGLIFFGFYLKKRWINIL